MSKAIATQHPAVVLRSHYKQLRALLAVAMIAVLGLSAAVVTLATNDDGHDSAGSGSRVSAPAAASSIRYDGGPEEGTRGMLSRAASSYALPGTRYDGGPEEGSRGPRR